MAITGKEPSSRDHPPGQAFPSCVSLGHGGFLALGTLAKLPSTPLFMLPAPPTHRGKKTPFSLHLYRDSQSNLADLKEQCQNNVTGIRLHPLGNMARIFDRIYIVGHSRYYFSLQRQSLNHNHMKKYLDVTSILTLACDYVHSF